jgi:hypothetical protein
MVIRVQITGNGDEPQQSIPELSLSALSRTFLAEVTQDGLALADVPKALKTPGLCRAAVAQDGRALRSVPKALKTPELCRTAVEQDA